MNDNSSGNVVSVTEITMLAKTNNTVLATERGEVQNTPTLHVWHSDDEVTVVLIRSHRGFKVTSPAVRSVTRNLANKFSQCTFSVAEHYDLFSDLIILRQAWWRRTYDVIPHRPHRTDRETAAGKAQRYHTDLKLIYMLPIISYTTIRQFRVDVHFKSARNNRRRLYKGATPTR